MSDTSIEWADKTWNCLRGCSLTSDGCRNCYAMRQAHRFSGPGGPYEGLTVLTATGPKWSGEVREVPGKLGEPMGWRKPSRIFVNSMSDVFHDDVSDGFIDRMFGVMMLCPQHIFQILTKRPERMFQYMNEPGRAAAVMAAAAREAFDQDTLVARHGKMPKTAEYHWEAPDELAHIQVKGGTWPPPNVWLGTSVENQKTADIRVPLLVQTMAAVRWLSVEPMLGPVNLGLLGTCPKTWGVGYCLLADRIHWVVCGGESGPGARSFDVHWADNLMRECRSTRVAFFMKQVGSRPIRSDLHVPVDGKQPSTREIRIRMNDRKGGDMSEWPKDLRVREYPAVN